MTHAHSKNPTAPSVGAPPEKQAQRERCVWRLVRRFTAFAWLPWINNPHAVHQHYLRIGNGWEVWTSERVRGMERHIERLEGAVKYLAHECDPKRNGFESEYPELRHLSSPNTAVSQSATSADPRKSSQPSGG